LILFLTAGLSLCLWLTACGSQKEPQTSPPKNEPQTQRYELKGKVVSVDKSQTQMLVDHEAIPGFMGAMAMSYPVKDPKLLDGLAPGDQITAQVVVSGDNLWLENIVVVKK
jgi:protein SCO1/2